MLDVVTGFQAEEEVRSRVACTCGGFYGTSAGIGTCAGSRRVCDYGVHEPTQAISGGMLQASDRAESSFEAGVRARSVVQCPVGVVVDRAMEGGRRYECGWRWAVGCGCRRKCVRAWGTCRVPYARLGWASDAWLFFQESFVAVGKTLCQAACL